MVLSSKKIFFAMILITMILFSGCLIEDSLNDEPRQSYVEAGIIEFTFTPLNGTDPQVVYLAGEFND